MISYMIAYFSKNKGRGGFKISMTIGRYEDMNKN